MLQFVWRVTPVTLGCCYSKKGKNMKKKMISLLLAGCMLSVVLLGCGEKPSDPQGTNPQTTAGQTDTQAATDAATAAVTTAATSEETATEAVTTEEATTEAITTAEPETTGEPVTYEVIERNGYVNTFDITDYGAVGDGVTDCTAAVQAALDEAGRVEGTVLVPPGKYKVGQLKMHPRTRLEGDSAWNYRADGNSVFILNDPNATCMIDITGAYGCTITGMSLNGGYLGQSIHGVYLNWPAYNGGAEEDTPTVEDCRIGNFTGDGVHLKHIWCFTVRHNMIHHNNGSGLYIDGWDGFILDNWFSGNLICGVYGDPWVASVTFTGNRVEWNGQAGIWFKGGDSLTLTGNFFDRSFGPAVKLGDGSTFNDVTVTGNLFRRSGCPDWGELPTRYDSSHLYLKNAQNVSIVGNTFKWGTDDTGGGTQSPDYDVYLSASRAVIIANNTMYEGSLKRSILQFDCENIVVDKNISHHNSTS